MQPPYVGAECCVCRATETRFWLKSKVQLGKPICKKCFNKEHRSLKK